MTNHDKLVASELSARGRERLTEWLSLVLGDEAKKHLDVGSYERDVYAIGDTMHLEVSSFLTRSGNPEVIDFCGDDVVYETVEC